MATTTIVGQRWKVYPYADNTGVTPADGEGYVVSGLPGFESSNVMLMGDGVSTVAQLAANKQYQAIYSYADVSTVILAGGYQYAITDVPGSTLYVQIVIGDGTHTIAELVGNMILSVIDISHPIGDVIFQGPNDSDPATLYPGTTWDDVSWEEANMTRRTAGDLAGARFTGVPAHLAVSVTGGVPTVSITNGGSGYLSGGSGTITLTLVGTCSTQATRTATVTNGVITAINVVAAGAGYTSGKVAVYDGVVGHGDLLQSHAVTMSMYVYGAATPYTGVRVQKTSGSDSPEFFTSTVLGSLVSDNANGALRSGAETSTAWVTTVKWRRTA